MVQAAPYELADRKDGSEEAIALVRDFFGANPKQQHIAVVLNAETLRKAETLIKTCEHCNEEGAEFLFAVILDRVTGSNPKITDYVADTPARCPSCLREISEKTLIEPA